MKKAKIPKTWDELLDAGYVRELSEEEVAIFRLKTGQLDRGPFVYETPAEAMARSNEAEAISRSKLKGKSK